MTLTHLIIASASATAILHCNWKSRGDAAIYSARNGFKSIMEENPIYVTGLVFENSTIKINSAIYFFLEQYL